MNRVRVIAVLGVERREFSLRASALYTDIIYDSREAALYLMVEGKKWCVENLHYPSL